MDGTVSRVFRDKGFGFIKGKDKIEYFFHRSEYEGNFDDLVIEVDLGRMVLVSFDVVHSERGPRAGKVNRAGNEVRLP